MARNYKDFAATEEEAKLFDIAPFDKDAGRAKLVGRMAKALKQSQTATSGKGERDFVRTHNNGIRFAPTLNGQRIYLTDDHEDSFNTTQDKFGGLIEQIGKDIDAGEFDDQIQAALEAAPSPTSPKSERAGTGSKRSFSEASSLSIGVAAKRRSKTPPSFEDIRKSYIEQGANAELLDEAIAKRKAAEKVAK